jgi:hypothetical protein
MSVNSSNVMRNVKLYAIFLLLVTPCLSRAQAIAPDQLAIRITGYTQTDSGYRFSVEIWNKSTRNLYLAQVPGGPILITTPVSGGHKKLPPKLGQVPVYDEQLQSLAVEQFIDKDENLASVHQNPRLWSISASGFNNVGPCHDTPTDKSVLLPAGEKYTSTVDAFDPGAVDFVSAVCGWAHLILVAESE